MAKKKKSKGGSNPFMDGFKKKDPLLARVYVPGQGERWIDPSQAISLPYNPEVLKIGGAEHFARFMYLCLSKMGIGTSPENNYEWDVRTRKVWCDPKDVENFPLKEPGPGRFIVPIYLFAITKIAGKPFKWACYAEVEDILRGCHIEHQEIWVREYCEKIQTGILDKLKTQNEG